MEEKIEWVSLKMSKQLRWLEVVAMLVDWCYVGHVAGPSSKLELPGMLPAASWHQLYLAGRGLWRADGFVWLDFGISVPRHQGIKIHPGTCSGTDATVHRFNRALFLARGRKGLGRRRCVQGMRKLDGARAAIDGSGNVPCRPRRGSDDGP